MAAFGRALSQQRPRRVLLPLPEQPEGRRPGVTGLRDRRYRAGKGQVRELAAAMDMKCWERAKEPAAITERLSSLPG